MPMAPKAFDLASFTSSIPVINSGWVVSITPTKSWLRSEWRREIFGLRGVWEEYVYRQIMISKDCANGASCCPELSRNTVEWTHPQQQEV
jgi:hypothetical protein